MTISNIFILMKTQGYKFVKNKMLKNKMFFLLYNAQVLYLSC